MPVYTLPDALLYLASLVDPETMSPYIEAEVLLQEINAVGHYPALEEAFTYSDTDLTKDYIDRIDSVYYDTLLDVLESYGIIVSPDLAVNFQDIALLIRRLLNVSDEANADALSELELEGDTKELLITALAAVEPDIDTHFYREWIDEVMQRLVKVILESGELSDVSIPDPEYNDILHRYIEFLDGRRKGVVYDYVNRVSELPVDASTVGELIYNTLENQPGVAKHVREWLDLWHVSALDLKSNVIPITQVIDQLYAADKAYPIIAAVEKQTHAILIKDTENE